MDGATMENIALWDTKSVDNFLKKNDIFGCSSVIQDNNIDGVAFLNLDSVSLKNLGLIFVERCKINALLNRIASETSRKEFTTMWSQRSGKFRSATLPHPPVPAKPSHLRQAYLSSGSSQAERTLEPGCRGQSSNNSGTIEKTSCSNKSQENVGYERLIQSAWAPPTNCKPDNGIVSAPFATTNWDDGDSFSSDEFSDCDEDEWKPTTPEPVFVPQQQRYSGPTSTPPSLPSRVIENYRSSSPSPSMDGSRTLRPDRKISLPAPPAAPPPPPPGRRPFSTSGASSSRSPRGASPLPEQPVQRTIENDAILTKPWYFKVNRKEAERALQQCVEGAFLIRPTEHGAQNHRYTMSIIFNRRIFHIPVRQKPNGRWALGSEKLDEETFKNVEDLVEEHRNKPINLHTDGRLVGTTCLVIWPSRQLF